MRALPPPVPSIFIVGFPKCGSTTLHDVLVAGGAQPATVKEPGVLLLDRPALSVAQRYVGYYDVQKGGPRIDSTPHYIYDEDACARLAELDGASHVLVTVREPFARLRSAYVEQVRLGRERRRLADALSTQLDGPFDLRRAPRSVSQEYLASSCYAGPVRRLLDSSLVDRVRFIALERFDDSAAVADLRRWVGLDVPDDWTCSNPQRSSASAAPALVHRAAEFVGGLLPDRAHRRLAPLAKPAMARLSTLNVPTRCVSDVELSPALARRVAARLAMANDQLQDVTAGRWLGSPPTWIDEGSSRQLSA